jgi:endonuclease YncB( thermonuclease family)
MKKCPYNVVAATLSRHVLPTQVNFTLMSVQNVILFIPVNKKCWIPQVELINFVVSTACHKDLVLNNLFLKNALSGRFFMLTIFLLFSSFSYSSTHHPTTCVSAHFDEQAQIDYVIDGDTVVLQDKRHVRLIGINTPELGHDDKRPEPGAEAAYQSLNRLLMDQNVQLVFGKERLDKYGRTLAHVYLNNGLNIQAEMLINGLAMPLRIAPNLSMADCYASASAIAKQEEIGLWALSRYKTHTWLFR